MRKPTFPVLLLLPLICTTIVGASGPTVSTTSIPQALYPYAYDFILSASGGVAPYQWQQCGVPDGTNFPGTLNASSGDLAFGSMQWPVSQAGKTILFGVSVTDAAANISSCQALSLYMNSNLMITGSRQVTFDVGVDIGSYQIGATYNFQPNSFAITGGNPPPGLRLSSGGILNGTPTQIGTYTFQITVTDSTGSSVSDNFTVSIVQGGPPVGVLQSVTCVPQVVTTSQNVTCTAVWGANAPSFFLITIATNNPFVTFTSPLPVYAASAGATSLTFTLTVASFSVNGTALIQVTGDGSASTTLSLQAGPQLASLACASPAIESKQSTLCTVSLQNKVSSDSTVFLTALSQPITFPNTVTIPAGSTSVSFPVTALSVNNPATFGLSAQCNSTSATASLTVLPSVPVSALTCTPASFSSPGSTTCTVNLNGAAPASGTTVSVASDNASLAAPATITVPAGQSSTTFTATAAAIANSQTANLTALSGTGPQAFFSLSISAAPKVSGLACQPSTLAAGATATCTVSLTIAPTGSYAVAISSNNAALTVPASVAVSANQTSATFQAKAGGATSQQVIVVTASANGSAQASITVSAAAPPVLTAPASVTGTLSAGVQFLVSASDPGGLPVTLSASGLPKGASFDAAHGQFTWSPDATQLGTSTVTITATNGAALSATKAVAIDVIADIPVILNVYNSASYATGNVCSPGALASIDGLLLTNQAAQIAPSPWPAQLAGVRVLVNGTAAPLYYASPTLVHFQCPYLDPGTPLSVTLVPPQGATPPAVSMSMQGATPGLYILSSYSPTQGAIVIAPAGEVAMPKTNGIASRPALPGEYLEIYADGLGGVSASVAPGSPAPSDQVVSLNGAVSVTIGGVAVKPAFSGLAPGEIAMFQVNVQIPANLPAGPAVPLFLSVTLPDGTVVKSNTVTVAIGNSPAQ